MGASSPARKTPATSPVLRVSRNKLPDIIQTDERGTAFSQNREEEVFSKTRPYSVDKGTLNECLCGE